MAPTCVAARIATRCQNWWVDQPPWRTNCRCSHRQRQRRNTPGLPELPPQVPPGVRTGYSLVMRPRRTLTRHRVTVDTSNQMKHWLVQTKEKEWTGIRPKAYIKKLDSFPVSSRVARRSNRVGVYVKRVSPLRKMRKRIRLKITRKEVLTMTIFITKMSNKMNL